MATYKTGDKVLVRSDLSKAHGAGEEMVENWAGKVVTIAAVEPDTLFGKLPNSYHIEEDTKPTAVKYVWWDNRFEGLASEGAEPKEEVKPKNPMPELKNGMFGMEHDGELFVVVDDMAVYQMGLCEDVDFLVTFDKIKALYESTCFKQIKDGRAKMIWSADGEIVEPKKDECCDIATIIDLLEKALDIHEDDGK